MGIRFWAFFGRNFSYFKNDKTEAQKGEVLWLRWFEQLMIAFRVKFEYPERCWILELQKNFVAVQNWSLWGQAVPKWAYFDKAPQFIPFFTDA